MMEMTFLVCADISAKRLYVGNLWCIAKAFVQGRDLIQPDSNRDGTGLA
jgi:hypothetical protein